MERHRVAHQEKRGDDAARARSVRGHVGGEQARRRVSTSSDEGATGWFSYWSVRAGNRPFNKGLRLDYTLASRRLFDGGSDGVEVVDAFFILDEYQGSTTVPPASRSPRESSSFDVTTHRDVFAL